MPLRLVSGISSGFPGLFQSLGQVTHVLLTRSPLITQEQALKITVRLACVKHAASVRPEPGSNSPLMNGIPQQNQGKNHTHKGICSLAEHEQPALAVVRCPTKGYSRTAPTTEPEKAPRRTRHDEVNWHRFLTRC